VVIVEVMVALMVISDGAVPEALRAVFDAEPDPPAAEALVRTAFPIARVVAADSVVPLSEVLQPPGESAFAAAHPGLDVLVSRRLWDDRPDLAEMSRGRHAVLFLTSPVTSWVTFASWTDGEVVRAVSASERRGVVQDVGAPLPFEVPGLALPVLGERALRWLAGIGGPDASRIRLSGFRVTGRTRAERAAFRAAYDRSLSDWAASGPQTYRFGPDGRLLP
jgi:Family of unknown function (DUF6928)